MTTYGEVVEVEQLTPRMVRVVLGGDGLADFTPTEWTDQYVNALFVPPGAPYAVPFDPDEARQLAPEHRPHGRRYTIRWWDPATRRVAIDFVVHGDVGIAGRWAAAAGPVTGCRSWDPAVATRRHPTADAHLMVGDESALPAIAASLERVARRCPGARGAPSWTTTSTTSTSAALATSTSRGSTVAGTDPEVDPLLPVVEALELPPGRVQVFVHGEAAEVRAVRRHLLGDRGIPKPGTSISPYWRRHLTDERWREVKAEWLAAQELDV